MTKQTGFKRRVRARMAKTGESYATARSRLLAGHPGVTPDDLALDWMPEALHISNGDATDVPGTGLARRVVYCSHRRTRPDDPQTAVASGRTGMTPGEISAILDQASPPLLGVIATLRADGSPHADKDVGGSRIRAWFFGPRKSSTMCSDVPPRRLWKSMICSISSSRPSLVSADQKLQQGTTSAAVRPADSTTLRRASSG
jgi:hypothetical protein